jgi:hypothetical protein
VRVLIQSSGYFLILSEVGVARELLNTDVPPGLPLPHLPPEWVGSIGAEPAVRPLVLRGTDRNWTAASTKAMRARRLPMILEILRALTSAV